MSNEHIAEPFRSILESVVPKAGGGAGGPSRSFWYETQERAMAPGSGDGWPEVIAAPHSKNARLVRRTGSPSGLLAACKALRDIIHDDLTHARQRDHAEAINAADAAIREAGGAA